MPAIRHIAALLAVGATAACYTPPPQVAPARAQAEAAARTAIAREDSLDVATIPERTIAVPPLAVASGDTAIAPLAYGLADLLATDLARSPQLTVVERLRMDALLRELQLTQSGSVDSSTAPRVGRLVGARQLVVGAMTSTDSNEIILEARIGNVVTGQVETVASARAPLDRILEAEVALVFQIFEKLGVTLTPGERAAIEAQATKNITALLAYSRGVRAETNGLYDAAAAEYRAALAADPSFAAAAGSLQAVQPPPATNQVSPTPGAAARAGGKTEALGRVTQSAVSAVNPSLADVSGAGEGASSAVSQGQSSGQSGSTQRDPVVTTLVIPIRQVP